MDRDDVHDHGSSHISETVRQLKAKTPHLLVEVLTPTSGRRRAGQRSSWVSTFSQRRDRRAPDAARPRPARGTTRPWTHPAAKAANPGLVPVVDHARLGETDDEIPALRDLRSNDVDVATGGQFPQPTSGTSRSRLHGRPAPRPLARRGPGPGLPSRGERPLAVVVPRGRLFVKNVPRGEAASCGRRRATCGGGGVDRG